MDPVIDLDELTHILSNRLQHGYRQSDLQRRVQMVGIAFARPNSAITKAEVIPQIADWHYRSGNHIDFFFAGYTYPHPPVKGFIEVPIPGRPPWLYSAERFNAFRVDLESRTTWRYGGGTELLLANARLDTSSGQGVLDFSSMVCCQLDTMKDDKSFDKIEIFFEKIFRFAETANDDDPTWSFSDQMGMNAAGSALKRVVLSLLPKPVEDMYKQAAHFAVRDVGRV